LTKIGDGCQYVDLSRGGWWYMCYYRILYENWWEFL